jgi:hypothetical protein
VPVLAVPVVAVATAGAGVAVAVVVVVIVVMVIGALPWWSAPNYLNVEKVNAGR